MQYRENGETGYSQKCICRSDLILWGWGVVVMVEAARVSQFCSFLITVAAGTSHLASPFCNVVLNLESAPFTYPSNFVG